MSGNPDQLSDTDYLNLISNCLNELIDVRILSSKSENGLAFWRLSFKDKIYSVVAGANFHSGVGYNEPTIVFSWAATPFPFSVASGGQIMYFDLRFRLRSRNLGELGRRIEDRFIAHGLVMNFFEPEREQIYFRRALKYSIRKARYVLHYVAEAIPETFASLLVRRKPLDTIESAPFTIRIARESDLPELYEMFRRTFLFKPDKRRIKFYLRKFNSLFLVVVNEDRVIAFFFSIIKTRVTRRGIELVGHIYDLAVRPEYRGKGIAMELHKITIKRMREMGIKSATGYYYSDNEAMAHINQVLGFKPTGGRMGLQYEAMLNLDTPSVD